VSAWLREGSAGSVATERAAPLGDASAGIVAVDGREANNEVLWLRTQARVPTSVPASASAVMSMAACLLAPDERSRIADAGELNSAGGAVASSSTNATLAVASE